MLHDPLRQIHNFCDTGLFATGKAAWCASSDARIPRFISISPGQLLAHSPYSITIQTEPPPTSPMTGPRAKSIACDMPAPK